MLKILPIITWLGICLVASAAEDPSSNTQRDKQTPQPASSRIAQKANPASPVEESKLTSNDRKLLDWFDTLGFPDLSKSQFGRVLGQHFFHVEGEDPNAERVLGTGFLLQEDKTSLTIFESNLSTTTFSKPGKDQDFRQDARFEALNLEQAVANFLKQLATPPDDDKDILPRWFGRRTPERVEALLVARACAAKGHTTLAHQLLHYVATIPDPRTDQVPAADNLLNTLAGDISQTVLWQNFEALDNRDIGRTELLRRFRHFSKTFPGPAAAAREIKAVLERMVKEDDEHRKPPALDKLSLHDRVEELIFQLRDEHGSQMSNPGRCAYDFEYSRDFALAVSSNEKGSAGMQLIDLGFDAVPQLIAHLDDTRLTRAIGFHRSFYFSHYVLRVGDAARAILEQIAGREFYRRKSTSSEMIKDGEVAKVRAAVEAWWADARMKGEKQFLIDEVLKQETRSSEMARRLLIKYPDAVLDAVSAATQKPPKELWTYTKLVRIAAAVPGDKVTQFLADKLTNEENLSVRVVAAEELLKRKHSLAVPMMIKEWQQFLGAASQDQAGKSQLKSDPCGEVVRFLIASRNPEATRAITAGLDQLEVEARLAVVYSFALRENFPTLEPARGLWMHFSDENPPLVGELVTAVEDLLVKSLGDRAESTEITGTWNGKPIHSVRISDVAALILADRWKADYKFDLATLVAQRDRQLAVIKNVWRKRHDLPLLPIPE